MINYIHANPVHHGYTQDADAWPWSSCGHYLKEGGQAMLDAWKRDYDIQSYVEGWDAP